MVDRVLRPAEVLETLGLSYSALRKRVEAGEFPEPIRLGGPGTRAIGWRWSEIENWLDTRERVPLRP